MKKIAVFTFFAFVLILAGCGGGNTAANNTNAGPANASLFTGDAVNPAILRFELTVSAITLTGTSPTPTTGNLLSQPAEVEFVHQAGTFEPLALVNIPAGTYSGATLTVSNPQVVVVNGTTPTTVPATLSSTTITVTFSPSITVSSTSNSQINFDLDLAASVTLNGNPVITSATVNPKFNVTTSTVNATGKEDDDSGEIEDVHGSVTAIAAPNFTLQTAQATITFVTDSTTRFSDGIAQLSDLKAGDIVEVDGVTRSDGSKLATKVEREGTQSGDEVEGIISAVTGTPATALTIARQISASANTATTVDITVNSSTVFSVRADKLSLITPAFDASHIGKGQRIEADATTAGSPLVATKLKLREQGIVGQIAASPVPTASSFTLNIDPTSAFGKLSGATSVTVIIPNGAQEKATPSAGATVLVRGLVFVNGSTYTMIGTREESN
ncbi:MAG TPA: DUF5666 domain-containing protein [Candidatus Saccharimonadales bacterium]|jgi:hypothetical protein|nr:DUF5666 domain-containing protein [Candidatus Saccharimonadales bacterium]